MNPPLAYDTQSPSPPFESVALLGPLLSVSPSRSPSLPCVARTCDIKFVRMSSDVVSMVS